MIVTNQTRALAHEILAYWLRFNRHNQETWVDSDVDDDVEILQEALPTGATVNVCGTTMCAAGTAVFLSKPVSEFKSFVKNAVFNDWMGEGAELLGLTPNEARLVFLSDNKSAKRYMRAIADGSQKKFDKATEKRVAVDG